MPRIARIVIPHAPHHIVQRGNRRQDVFFEEADYRTYLSLIKEQCELSGTDILAYCLMTNHVHLIAVPKTPDGLRPLGEAHRRYTRYINFKNDWRGYLWQGRFASYPMDEAYLYEAVRYVELNPVRAGLVSHPAQYRWSSARQRIRQASDGDYKVKPLPPMVDDWETYWTEGIARYEAAREFEANEFSQRPLGKMSVPTKGTQ